MKGFENWSWRNDIDNYGGRTSYDGGDRLYGFARAFGRTDSDFPQRGRADTC